MEEEALGGASPHARRAAKFSQDEWDKSHDAIEMIELVARNADRKTLVSGICDCIKTVAPPREVAAASELLDQIASEYQPTFTQVLRSWDTEHALNTVYPLLGSVMSVLCRVPTLANPAPMARWIINAVCCMGQKGYPGMSELLQSLSQVQDRRDKLRQCADIIRKHVPRPPSQSP